MHILWALLIGLIVGTIAKFLMLGRHGGGMLVTILIGMVGSLIGMAASFVNILLGRALGLDEPAAPAGFVVMPLLGAVLLLGLYHAIYGPRLGPRGHYGQIAGGSGSRADVERHGLASRARKKHGSHWPKSPVTFI